MATSQHVIPTGRNWAVRRAGSLRSSGIYQTQHEALDAARGIARNQGVDLYVHGSDGRIHTRETYAKTPAKG
jgi:Uncharacterized protein conserved in bacteria (DUF2188)